jgi:PAS domain S-box-containing protein
MDRRIFFFNTEAECITGYRREDVLGRDCHEA